jgi:hypothetical protein
MLGSPDLPQRKLPYCVRTEGNVVNNANGVPRIPSTELRDYRLAALSMTVALMLRGKITRQKPEAATPMLNAAYLKSFAV